ncbi:LCP family protein [Clostridium transplantifaecale]|uniref:LCP family protein n=1 Tax=Clostridium transplantifaecale TaxID=2479838 RepID=UPI000F631585|nr:LCP family protein [Clostridium transplantifaecale]
MGYDDEVDRSRNRKSRARQPVKRTGDREIEQRKYREPGYSQPGLNLITDTFTDGGGRRPNYDRPDYERPSHEKPNRGKPRQEQESRKKSRGRKEAKQEKDKGRGRGEPERGGGIYNTPARKKAKKRKRKIVIILFEVLILLSVIAFAAYSYVDKRLSGMSRLQWNPDEIKNIEISQEKQEQMKGYWTIAVFGVDSRNSSVGKGNNSDVNMVCNINMDTGEIKLVSIFRDTYLNVSDKNSYNKINAAYLQGGPEQAVKALNKNLDLDIDDYATFNWKAVADAINILGGIDVEISKAELYYINAFITETVKATGVYSVHLKKTGMNHLDGVQAVAYGRLRLMDTDYARTERQRKVITLAFEKFKKADWSTINNVIQTIYPQVSTSIQLSDLLSVARTLPKFHMGDTTGFPSSRGEAKMGKKGDCVIPQTLEKNVIELHKFLFGDENYVPTDTVKSISRKIISDTGLAKEAKPAGDVGTGGGQVPKSTAADETKETKEHGIDITNESGENEHSTHGTDESSSSGYYPGRPTEAETDSQGNMIFPSRENESNPSKPSERPGETETGSVIRPGTTEESTYPGTEGTGGYYPGGGSNGNSNAPGSETSPSYNNAPGGGSSNSQNQNQTPGSNTDTGVILPPGTGTGSGNGGNYNTPGSNNSGNNVEYSGPPGY